MGGWCEWIGTYIPVVIEALEKNFPAETLVFLHISMEFHPVLVSFAAQTNEAQNRANP
jgi:hypothetical protein